MGEVEVEVGFGDVECIELLQFRNSVHEAGDLICSVSITTDRRSQLLG